MKLFERHSMLHRQVYESTPFPEQSAEVSPMYNNIVIINGLVATLLWNDGRYRKRTS